MKERNSQDRLVNPLFNVDMVTVESTLNDHVRAGFVMASSATDSQNKDIREKLVETGAVDVMISVAIPAEDDGVDFGERMKELHGELAKLQKESNDLMVKIETNFREMRL